MIIDRLKNADPNDDVLFAQLVNDTLDALEMDYDVLALEFRMSRQGIANWAAGRTQPHPLMRPQIYATLVKLLEASSTP